MIGWRSLVSEEVANSSKAGISLLGEKAENHYNVSEVIPVDAPGSSQRSRIPTTGIGANLLPTLSLQWSIWPVFAGIAPHEYVTNAFGTGTTTPPTSD
ncbi:MAG: hypothetical protein HKN81_07990 [Gammaproteobacteria bacterium]|nr:hypothetical protein [Gammaproteobacteria bacterium]